MKKLLSTMILCLILISFNDANATSVLLYDIDFESPSYTVGSEVPTGPEIDTVSNINLGSVNTSLGLGDMNQCAELNTFGNQSPFYTDQFELAMDASMSNITLSFEFTSDNYYGFETENKMSLIFDTPTGNILNIYANGSMSWLNQSGRQTLGSYDHNQINSISLEIDLINNEMDFFLNGEDLATSSFLNSGEDNFSSIFSFGGSNDSSSSFYIDNIMATANDGMEIAPVPEAPTILMLGMGMLLFVSLVRGKMETNLG